MEENKTRLQAVVIIVAMVVSAVMLAAFYKTSFVESDFEKKHFAERRFSRLADNCSAGQGNECNRLGLALESGHGATQDLPKAFDAFKKACELKNFYGCSNAGRLRFEQADGRKDEKEALGFLTTACFSANHGMGCDYLGKLRSSAEDAQILNYEKAFEAYGMACKLGIGKSCALRNLFILEGRHKIPTKDVAAFTKRAIDDFKKRCAVPPDILGCTLYWEYLKSKGEKPANHKKIVSWFEQQPVGKDAKALGKAVYEYFAFGAHKRSDTTGKSLAEYCDTGVQKFGHYWQNGGAKSRDSSAEQAAVCLLRARLAQETGDLEVAKKYYERTCDIDKFLGCADLKRLDD